MRLERKQIVEKVLSEFWNEDTSGIYMQCFPLENLSKAGWKFVGLLTNNWEQPIAVIKVYFRGDGFENEVAGINAANSFPQIGNIYTPKVLRIFPEYKAIISEFVKIRNSRFAQKRIFLERQAINWNDIGLWLRHFHDSFTSSQNNIEFIKQKFHRSIEQTHKFENHFSNKHIRKIHSIITSADNDLQQQNHEWVISHGDFGVGNISTTDNLVYIFDFENSSMTPRGYEAIFFMSCMEATIYFLYRKRMFSWISNAFFDGYGMHFSTNTLNNFFYLLGKLETLWYYHKHHNTNYFERTIYSNMEKQVAKSLSDWLEETEKIIY